MTITVNIHEAKTHLSRLLQGDEVIIAKAGKLIARLLPALQATAPRTPGNDAGQVILAADFDAPLLEFEP